MTYIVSAWIRTRQLSCLARLCLACPNFLQGTRVEAFTVCNPLPWVMVIAHDNAFGQV